MAQIKAIALDVDGVLTDGTLLWGVSGEEMKSFSLRDILGISPASRMGIIFALPSGVREIPGHLERGERHH